MTRVSLTLIRFLMLLVSIVLVYRMEDFAVELTRSWPVQHEVTTVELQYLCVSSIYVVSRLLAASHTYPNHDPSAIWVGEYQVVGEHLVH